MAEDDNLPVFPGSRIWFDEVERRLKRVEESNRRLMDPENGVFPRIEAVRNTLRSWAIMILTALVINLTMAVVLLTRSP